MSTGKRISDLPINATLNNADLLEISQQIASVQTSGKVTLGTLASFLASAVVPTVTFAQVLLNGNTSSGTPVNMNDDDQIQFGDSRVFVAWYRPSFNRMMFTNVTSTDYMYFHDAGGIDISTTAFKLVGLTADTVPYLNASKVMTSSAVSPTALGYIANLSSDAQTQLTGKLNLSGGTMTGPLILYTNTPATALEAASKGYVDSLVEGLDWKESVITASTADEPVLSGVQSVGGVVVGSGARVLLKDQTTATDNGIWVVDSFGPWLRAADASTGAELEYAVVNVLQGTNADKVYRCSTYPITLGVTPIVWSEWNVASYLAGSGLTLTGSTFSIAAGAITNAMLNGSIAASKLVGTDIVTVGTLTAGATGAGFTLNFGASTLSGSIPVANTDAKIKGALTGTLGLISYCNGTADTVTNNANLLYDTVNAALIVGTTALVSSTDVAHFYKNQNAFTRFLVKNDNASAATTAGFTATNGTSSVNLYQLGTLYTTSGNFRPNTSALTADGAGGMIMYSANNGANAQLYFYTSATLRMSISSTGLYTLTNAVASTHNHTMINTSASNGAYCQYTVSNNTSVINLGMVGTATTTSGVYVIGEAYNMTTATGYSMGTLNAAGVVRIYTANGVLAQYINASGDTGIGTTSTVSARLHVIKTTEQVRIGYDTSNYYSTTVSSAGAVTFNAVGASSSFIFSDTVIFNAPARLFGYTVATLPAGPTKGDTAYVTDATAPTFLGVIAGGGAVNCPVFYDGTNWVAY